MVASSVPLIDNCVITIVGPRGRGKSYLVNQLLESSWNDFDSVTIFCPSLDVNDDYWTPYLRNAKNVHFMSEFNAMDIDELFRRQYECKKLVVANKRTRVIEREPKECPRMLVILDDVIDSG